MPDWNTIFREQSSVVWQAVYRIVNNQEEATDCCQEVFLEAWQRSQKAPVTDWPAFLRWLSVRRAIDLVRKRKSQPEIGRIDYDAIAPDSLDNSPLSQLELADLKNRLISELAKLPEQQSAAFCLRTFEELTYTQIALQLGVSVNQVGVLIHRARENLSTNMANFRPVSENSKERPR